MRRVSTPVLLWIAVVAILGAGSVAAASAVTGVLRTDRPVHRERPSTGAGTRRGAIWIAGSGSNLPLTRALAEAYRREHPEARLVVHESIGSTGGIRAAADRAIDLGLVSRPLKEQERTLGLRVEQYARVSVVFAVHSSVPDRGISRAAILEIYRGRRTRWSDGSPIVPLLRERGDSGHVAVAQVLPAFADASDAAWRSGRWRVLYHDRAMQEALLGTEGAIGPFDLGAIVTQDLPLRALSIDGVPPATPGYPFQKELAFVYRADLRPEARAFVRFATSPAARDLITSLGYVPAAEAGGR
jgi:phosphate transport system substrate-binding protein